MECPKCGHMQTDNYECQQCGVIFSRIKKKEEKTPEVEKVSTAGRRSISAGLAGWAVAVLLAVAMGCWYFIAPRQEPLPIARQQTSGLPTPPIQEESQKNTPPQRQHADTWKPPQADKGLSGLAGSLDEAFPATTPLEQARNATVFIKTPWGSGSGFFVSDNGHIVTNRHVVDIDPEQLKNMKDKVDRLAADLDRDRKNQTFLENQLAQMRDQEMRSQIEEELRRRRQEYDKYSAIHKEAVEQLQLIENSSWQSDLKVILIDGSEYSAQSLVMSDRVDLALLTISCYNSPFIRPTRQRSDQGQKVYSIGNPYGLRHTVTAGIISGFREHEGKKFIQIDAPINPGNSGGPLIDEQGKALGINTMVMQNTQGIGFAIPFQYVETEFGLSLGIQ